MNNSLVTTNISNAEYYMQLLNAAEQALRMGWDEQEESILVEMDQLWREMSNKDKEELDLLIGTQAYGD